MVSEIGDLLNFYKQKLMAYNKERLTVSLRDCKCAVCGQSIRIGETCWINPKEKTAVHPKCKK